MMTALVYNRALINIRGYSEITTFGKILETLAYLENCALVAFFDGSARGAKC